MCDSDSLRVTLEAKQMMQSERDIDVSINRTSMLSMLINQLIFRSVKLMASKSTGYTKTSFNNLDQRDNDNKNGFI